MVHPESNAGTTSATVDRAHRRRRGRPRDPGKADTILEAALAEYAERGWSGFTLDGVARRARVGKSTIYLRWENRDALLIDTVNGSSFDFLFRTVDTGNLFDDLLELAANLLEHFLSPSGRVNLRFFIDIATQSTTGPEFHERVVESHHAVTRTILDRAVERGEMRPEVDHRAVVELIYGGVTMHALGLAPDERELSRDAITDRLRSLVGIVMEAISPRSA